MSITKSCIDCPSLLSRADAQDFFGQGPLGITAEGPMCSRYGHVFGTGGNDDLYVEAVEKYAAGCISFGSAKPTAPSDHLTLSWFRPRPELLEPKNDGRVSNCDECVKFDSVEGACAATGRLLPHSRRSHEASKCSWKVIRELGQASHEVGDELFTGAVTQVSVTVKSNPTPTKKATPKKMKPVSDPASYSSDAPVTDEHKAQGIASWRKHETPRGKVYYLPIFASDYFGDRADLIPSVQSDYGDPSLYIDHADLLTEFAVQVYRKDLNLVLYGEPGSGKTEGVRWLAWQLNMPFVRLAYTEDTDPDQVLGIYQFDPTKGTYFAPGLLPENWQLPGFLLSDETNLAQEAITQTYRSMNDSSRELVVYREKYRRHDYCFHLMAMNPHWDFRNIGAKPLASADSRRMAFHWMPNPDKKQLAAILTSTLTKLDKEAPSADLIKIIIAIGEDLREMSKAGTLPDFWTVAQEIKVARLVDDFGIEGAYRRAYFNYLDPQDAEPAMAAIKSHVPYTSDWA